MSDNPFAYDAEVSELRAALARAQLEGDRRRAVYRRWLERYGRLGWWERFKMRGPYDLRRIREIAEEKTDAEELAERALENRERQNGHRT